MLTPLRLVGQELPQHKPRTYIYIYVVRRHLAPLFLQVEGLVVVHKYEAGAML